MSIQFDFANETLERMSGRGVFLTVGEDKPNTMTIGWGSISVYWGKPIFIVPVRHSRYSYSILEEGDVFTVSVPPLTQEMNSALGICGSRSGRDTDKYGLAGLSLLPGRTVKVPVIAFTILFSPLSPNNFIGIWFSTASTADARSITPSF